jgi:hypothetical protein
VHDHEHDHEPALATARRPAGVARRVHRDRAARRCALIGHTNEGMCPSTASLAALLLFLCAALSTAGCVAAGMVPPLHPRTSQPTLHAQDRCVSNNQSFLHSLWRALQNPLRCSRRRIGLESQMAASSSVRPSLYRWLPDAVYTVALLWRLAYWTQHSVGTMVCCRRRAILPYGLLLHLQCHPRRG